MTTTIVTRAGKGAELTFAEIDANFTNLKATADAAASAVAAIGAATDTAISAHSAAMTSGVAINVQTLSLGVGQWEVTGIVQWYTDTSAITSFSALRTGLSSTSLTFGDTYDQLVIPGGSAAYNHASVGPIVTSAPAVHFSLATTTTIYLLAFSYFTVGTGSLNAAGKIHAVKVGN